VVLHRRFEGTRPRVVPLAERRLAGPREREREVAVIPFGVLHEHGVDLHYGLEHRRVREWWDGVE
jgi:hypothetical protein